MALHLTKGQEEMKLQTFTKLITLSLIAATTLHATNGDSLIGIGAKARGMGGTGIALSHGAESALSNAALITSTEGTEISFGGTLFAPTIKTQITNGAPGNPSYTSDADLNMIPEVSIAHKINDNWYIGVGMWGTAGMGTDYSNAGTPNATGQIANFNMVTNLQLLQFGVPIAYKTGGLSLSFTPIMQYGNLDINYRLPTGLPVPNDTTTIGAGLAQDFGFGYNLGFAYDFSANGVNGLTIGAIYKSSIDMEYKNQLSTATQPFGIVLPDGDHLEQPAEFGLGLAYTMNQHTFAFDYKKIKWSDAKGYQDFGWEDSDVYAFGYQFAQDNWAARVGYNHASSAVVEQINPALNVMNLLGFPANSEDHYTVGGTYGFSQQFSVDLAFVYSPKTTDTFSAFGIPGFAPGSTISTSHKESSLSFQLNYTF